MKRLLSFFAFISFFGVHGMNSHRLAPSQSKKASDEFKKLILGQLIDVKGESKLSLTFNSKKDHDDAIRLLLDNNGSGFGTLLKFQLYLMNNGRDNLIRLLLANDFGFKVLLENLLLQSQLYNLDNNHKANRQTLDNYDKNNTVNNHKKSNWTEINNLSKNFHNVIKQSLTNGNNSVNNNNNNEYKLFDPSNNNHIDTDEFLNGFSFINVGPNDFEPSLNVSKSSNDSQQLSTNQPAINNCKPVVKCCENSKLQESKNLLEQIIGYDNPLLALNVSDLEVQLNSNKRVGKYKKAISDILKVLRNNRDLTKVYEFIAKLMGFETTAPVKSVFSSEGMRNYSSRYKEITFPSTLKELKEAYIRLLFLDFFKGIIETDQNIDFKAPIIYARIIESYKRFEELVENNALTYFNKVFKISDYQTKKRMLKGGFDYIQKRYGKFDYNQSQYNCSNEVISVMVGIITDLIPDMQKEYGHNNFDVPTFCKLLEKKMPLTSFIFNFVGQITNFLKNEGNPSKTIPFDSITKGFGWEINVLNFCDTNPTMRKLLGAVQGSSVNHRVNVFDEEGKLIPFNKQQHQNRKNIFREVDIELEDALIEAKTLNTTLNYKRRGSLAIQIRDLMAISLATKKPVVIISDNDKIFNECKGLKITPFTDNDEMNRAKSIQSIRELTDLGWERAKSCNKNNVVSTSFDKYVKSSGVLVILININNFNTLTAKEINELKNLIDGYSKRSDENRNYEGCLIDLSNGFLQKTE